MHFQYMTIDHRDHHKNKNRSFLLEIFCLLTILGLVIICYDGDLTDNYDPPIFALQSPIIIYPTHGKITLLQLISESIGPLFINKNSFLTRAPPA
jgi:voltage-gated potassium channel Kch